MKSTENFFKKLDGFFSYSGWALRITMLILCVAWVVPVWKPYLSLQRQQKLATARYPDRCDTEQENQAQNEFYHLREKIVADANAKGSGYSPKDYFSDLKKFNTKLRYGECAVLDFRGGGAEFQRVLNDNIDKGYYSHAELEKYRAPYEAWQIAEERKRTGPDLTGIDKMNGHDILMWLLWFIVGAYFKIMLLVFFLYLIRMAEGGERGESDEGILSIFLDDKLKFFLAVVFWHRYLAYYPYSIKKRIIVEAELRRLGEPFRRLSKAEKEFIRRIAEADDKVFQDWRMTFRQDNREDFQRSFAKALLITLAILVLTPSPTTGNSRRGAVFWESAMSGPTISICVGQTNQQMGSLNTACMPDPIEPVRTKTIMHMIRLVSDKALEGPTRTIDHVPVLPFSDIAA